MNTSWILETEERCGSGVHGQQPVVLVRGRAATVWDAEGNAYIDCMSGHGVTNIGHAHPRVVSAMTEQMERLWICPSGFCNDQRAALLATLTDLAPGGLNRAFLCNSGTEAVEGAIKFARVATGRSEIISAMRAYHGRTLGALSATWNKAYREPVAPLVPGFSFVPYNRIDAMDEVITDRTAAVLLEVVQGEGGVHPGDGEYLRAVQALCHERGALLILDEVQTGFCRTGKMFAFEHHGLDPDLVCLAKALGGGFPIGAVLLGERVGQLPRRVHSSTFGGNPLACAAALAALRVYQGEDLANRAAKLGTRLRQGLEAIDSKMVREVRGLGLMLAIELRTKALPVLGALSKRGVLALSAGSMVLRFLPPLVIEEDEIDRVIEAVGEVIGDA